MNPYCILDNSKKCSESECFAYEIIEYVLEKINIGKTHTNTKKKEKEILKSYRKKLEIAYYLSKICHGNKKRKDGSFYFSHPQNVVRIILYEIGYLDLDGIIIGLLHDVLENFFMEKIKNDPNIPEILEIKGKIEGRKFLEILFGKDIASSVDKLSKNKLAHFDEKLKEQRDEHYFLNMQYYKDNELIAKIADRIHNFRTMEIMGSAHIIKKINETKKYFLPLVIDRIKKLQNTIEKTTRKDKKIYLSQNLLKIYKKCLSMLETEIDKVNLLLTKEELRQILTN